MFRKEKLEYRDGDVLLEGYLVNDEKKQGKKPVVLVVHDWSGKNDFACAKAEKLAALGYVGFAIDMYGKGKLGQSIEEKTKLMTPLINDRAKLQKRILAALDAIEKIPQTNQKQIGAIGYCFGGLCVLDLARSGAGVSAVVSFHGLLHAPKDTQQKPIKAKVLAFHGYDDPMVKPEQMIEFANEMTSFKTDWQLHVFGNTMHAFANPEANDPGFGAVYNKKADERSWIGMVEFFKEVFSAHS